MQPRATTRFAVPSWSTAFFGGHRFGLVVREAEARECVFSKKGARATFWLKLGGLSGIAPAKS